MGGLLLTFGDSTEHRSTFTIPGDGSWHHYCITRSSGLCDMYVDGVSVITQFTEAGTLATSNVTLIGNRDSLAADWVGNIDEVSIFNTALSAPDIAIISEFVVDLKTALSVTPQVWYRMGD